ncbi:collagen alpha-1(II) chain-like [Dendronephthya gigantea]|uniref:collagen alpha-1(II) chain-like n=1 Tax=Dendronephthya gigantea TaxID=151771 RepID=UPI00106CE3E3|nr:collagen alpha-1(II) chain-like [Dendronephthya gigantea]
MDFVPFFIFFVLLTTILFIRNSAEGRNDPKIFTKDGSLHIRSGDDGNIVFEHPNPGGKVIVAGQELNVLKAKGEKGEKGPPGTNGTSGVKGEIGAKGEMGDKGDKGERGEGCSSGCNGTAGVKGKQGPPGPPGAIGREGRNGSDGITGPKGERGFQGEKGAQGLPGLNGTVGEKGVNGTQGAPGVKGEKGAKSDTPEIFRVGKETLQCNRSTFGVLRYSSRRLQLCTTEGWQSFSYEPPLGCGNQGVKNVPETNYKAFLNADRGILFQFNGNSVPNVRGNFNITADISPDNFNLTYKEAVMRQAALFPGNGNRLNVSGISDDFWRNSNWSVMALLRYKNIYEKFVRVLGHGSTSDNKGLHLGIAVSDDAGNKKTVIHGYYSNDITFGTVEEEKWYHITWTSQKDQSGQEKRCIYINGDEHKCEEGKRSYQGSGVTTVGAWWDENYADDLLLDNLIIISGVVQYNVVTNDEKQICFAQKLDEKLP